MNKRSIAVILLCIAGLCGAVQAQTSFVPVTDRMLENPDPADWLMWRRTLNSWGYSPLSQITRANVGKLRQIWTHPMGTGIQEATPIVYKGVMYLPKPGNVIEAVNGATGESSWEYRRPIPDDLSKWFAGSPLK